MIRKPFRLLVVIVLGVLAVGLNVTLWKAWRAGPPHGAPIMGLMGRRGVTAVDPMNALFGMTMLISAAFLVSATAFFPGLTRSVRRWRDARWPPPIEKAPGPAWTCEHCHEENPGNFYECWKCQRMRPPKSEA
jgi:uncharacterized membrane protein YhaH (DUF805 family)